MIGLPEESIILWALKVAGHQHWDRFLLNKRVWWWWSWSFRLASAVSSCRELCNRSRTYPSCHVRLGRFGWIREAILDYTHEAKSKSSLLAGCGMLRCLHPSKETQTQQHHPLNYLTENSSGQGGGNDDQRWWCAGTGDKCTPFQLIIWNLYTFRVMWAS